MKKIENPKLWKAFHNFGERWMDAKMFSDFATELFQAETEIIYFDVNDTYVVALHG